MKICHVSDNHSVFYPLIGKWDVILHSGDLLPNNKPKTKSQEPLFQRDWIRDNSENFKRWIGDKPFIFSSGNHDYTDPCSELIDIGINAINIDNKIIEFNGYKFTGFPYLGYIGLWNWELKEQDMKIKVDMLVNTINKNNIDILVSHCPPFGLLDENDVGEYIGNVPLRNAIDREIKKLPKLLCVGHNHNDGGKKIKYKNMLVSNAATIYNIIDINDEE